LLWKVLTWFQSLSQWFSDLNALILKDSPSPFYQCYILKREYKQDIKNGVIFIDPFVFLQKWLQPTTKPMYTTDTPTLVKQRVSLFEYLEILNTSFGSTAVSLSYSELQVYADMPDSQDPNDAYTGVNFSSQGPPLC
jgi:hypothetical protein